MPLPLTYPRRRSRTAITIARKVPLWRFALAVLLCLTSLSLSCSRQQSRTPPPTNASPQEQTAQQNSPAAQIPPPQQENPGAQARAVIVAIPEPPEQPPQLQQAGGLPPYQTPARLFASGHTAAVTALAFTPDRQRCPTAA